MTPQVDRSLAKREVLKELGITDRLLKFWMNWYKLPLNRRGRGSTYPAATVETLRLIKRLSDTRYFTMRFVRDLLAAADGGDPAAIETAIALCRSRLVRSPARTAGRVMDTERTVLRAPPVPEPAVPLPASKKMGEDLL